jgi:hypothetical protein
MARCGSGHTAGAEGVTAPRNAKAKYDPEGHVRLGRAILGCLLERPELWEQASGLTADKFLLSLHSKVFSAIKYLRETDQCADIVSVCAELGEEVEPGDISALVDNAVPENFQAYIRQLHAALRDRKFHLLQERLEKTSTVEDRRGLVSEMQEVLADADGGGRNWRAMFHSWEEFEHLPVLNFAIEGFLQESGVNLIGGLSGHGKTLIMLATCKSLLSGEPLFGTFPVARPADRILYLVPEISGPAFNLRMRLFGLDKYHKDGRFFPRTLSIREQMELSDPRMLEAVKSAQGAHVFLDSVIRFTVGSENDSENARVFSDVLFKLLQAGAASVVGCHHSPKSFQSSDYMSLENILRGSSDFGALISVCWGVRQIDAVHNRIFVQNCKARDFEPCEAFVIEGRPHLDRSGQFQMHARPGEAGELRSYLQQKGGRPPAPDQEGKIEQALEMRGHGKSNREIATALGVSHTTVNKWFWNHDSGKTPDEDLQ